MTIFQLELELVHLSQRSYCDLVRWLEYLVACFVEFHLRLLDDLSSWFLDRFFSVPTVVTCVCDQNVMTRSDIDRLTVSVLNFVCCLTSCLLFQTKILSDEPKERENKPGRWKSNIETRSDTLELVTSNLPCTVSSEETAGRTWHWSWNELKSSVIEQYRSVCRSSSKIALSLYRGKSKQQKRIVQQSCQPECFRVEISHFPSLSDKLNNWHGRSAVYV